MPSAAVTHIQKSAPGPPQWMAMATPAMFPMPTVAESAVVRAWKWETSPGSLGSSYLPEVTANPWPSAADLDEAEAQGQEEAGAEEGDDHQGDGLPTDGDSEAPDVVVEPVDDLFDELHACLAPLASAPGGAAPAIPAILPEDGAFSAVARR